MDPIIDNQAAPGNRKSRRVWMGKSIQLKMSHSEMEGPRGWPLIAQGEAKRALGQVRPFPIPSAFFLGSPAGATEKNRNNRLRPRLIG
jgi:hypothetical protein